MAEEVKVELKKYEKTEFAPLSWDDYQKILDILFEKVNKYVAENNIRLDAVVPILRGGIFPGTFLAFKFDLLTILPIQYKYFFIGDKIKLKRILDFPKLKITLPEHPTFLLVENNHCFGLTATTAAKYIKKKFPTCKIIYAADTMDCSYQKNEFADAIFYGALTNDTKALSKEEAAAKFGIKPYLFLYPWENIEEEWTTVQAKQHPYKDVGQFLK